MGEGRGLELLPKIAARSSNLLWSTLKSGPFDMGGGGVELLPTIAAWSSNLFLVYSGHITDAQMCINVLLLTLVDRIRNGQF